MPMFDTCSGFCVGLRGTLLYVYYIEVRMKVECQAGVRGIALPNSRTSFEALHNRQGVMEEARSQQNLISAGW